MKLFSFFIVAFLFNIFNTSLASAQINAKESVDSVKQNTGLAAIDTLITLENDSTTKNSRSILKDKIGPPP